MNTVQGLLLVAMSPNASTRRPCATNQPPRDRFTCLRFTYPDDAGPAKTSVEALAVMRPHSRPIFHAIVWRQALYEELIIGPTCRLFQLVHQVDFRHRFCVIGSYLESLSMDCRMIR